MTEENPHAGQGSVVVDIGGDVGALIVVMPEQMILDPDVEIEVEIVPTGTAHQHAHPHDHHDHDHDHDGSHPPHVAVVPRPLPSGRVVASLVFGSLAAGVYDLYLRPDGPVEITAEIIGGEVTEMRWPGA